ncbi:MAG TPA: transposase, partial [Candidatus Nanoarchaeia archaeon]|nr:transposase [Candidatus Nanoarchaeia archaeon]
MKKEKRQVNKIKRLLKRLGCPRWLHHYGPKKFEFYIHVLCLLMKEACKLSFRRVSSILGMLGFDVPSYSALCKMRKRIPLWMWNKILQLTAEFDSYIVAVDSTGFSRQNPSFHYIKRIDRKNPVKSYVKLSSFFDTRKKKFIALRIRAKPRHDVLDVPCLLKQRSNMKKLVGDSAYDAESIHELAHEYDIITVIKPRKNVKRGYFRKKQLRHYSERTYHRRSIHESGHSGLKRRNGS